MTDDMRRACDRCFAPVVEGRFSPHAREAVYEELPGGGIRHKTFGYMTTPQGAIYCRRCTEHGIRFCHRCGCTDEEGCEEGCYWVGDDLCSECEPPGKTGAQERQCHAA